MQSVSHRAGALVLAVVVCAGVFSGGCGPSRQGGQRKQLLIYCGITMIRPMTEIARVIEKQENCEIIITKGGSGNLLRSIKTNKVGDLYLPGSDSYMKTCVSEGLATETVHVGYNKAAMMVQKGNPKKITADLANLTSTAYYVVICNPDSGSIGRETQRLLTAKAIFDEVIKNARALTTDSKDIAHALRRKEADLVVNWYATAVWAENEYYMDVLPIDEKYAAKKALVLGLLKTSRHPDIARKFMQYASSDKGRELFSRYGLYDVR